jgi:hypothetical protein
MCLPAVQLCQRPFLMVTGMPSSYKILHLISGTQRVRRPASTIKELRDQLIEYVEHRVLASFEKLFTRDTTCKSGKYTFHTANTPVSRLMG